MSRCQIVIIRPKVKILRNQVRWWDTDNNLASYHSRSLVQEARIVSPNRLIILGFLNHRGFFEQPWGAHRHDDLVSGQVIGKPTSLVDSNWKVTGQAKYGDDIRLPGEVIGRILRSPHHYARVLSIDISKALELPGVLGVATGEDAPGKFGVLPVTKDEHAMAVEKVRHVGDLVACVAAVDEPTAREACRLIEVEYEVLDSIHDIKQGLEDSENPIHDRGKYHIGESNVQKRVFQQFGNISDMKDSSVATHDSDWTFTGVNHGFTEPHAVVAHWDPSGD